MPRGERVDPLFESLGISPGAGRDKGALKVDLLAFLDRRTGSEERTCDIRAASTKPHVDAFINADDSRKWFSYDSTLGIWAHEIDRSTVVQTLTELARIWVKSRKEASKRRMATTSGSRQSGLPPNIAAASRSDRSSTMFTRNAAAAAASPERTPGFRRNHSHIIEYSDDEADPPHETDEQSLPDVLEIISPRSRGLIADQSPITSTAAAAGGDDTTSNMPHATLQSVPTSTPILAQPPSPASPIQQNLVSTPVIGLQLTVDEGDRATTPPNEADLQPGPSRKRARLTSETTPRRATAIEYGSAKTDIRYISVDAASDMLTGDAKQESIRAGKRPRIEFSDGIPITLSNSRSYSQKATYSIDALTRVPATILDYIAYCQQRSLGKANDKSASPMEAKRHQERCRLFRDLRADIESRILNMADLYAEEADGHIESTAFEEELERGMDDRKAQISSFCLWD